MNFALTFATSAPAVSFGGVTLVPACGETCPAWNGKGPLNAETGNDVFLGGPGNDRIGGGAGDDVINGGDGGDRIFGDAPAIRTTVAGNDFIVGGSGDDSIAGGGGFDVAYFELPRRAYAFQGAGFEFPSTNSNAADNPIEQGLRATTSVGGAAQTDLLIEIEELRFVDGRIVTNPDDALARVYRVYEAGLDRAPDPIGLNFWGAQVAAGLPVGALGNSVAQSPEFQARYGALDNAGFVQQMYANVLGRTGEPAGVAGWLDLLNANVTRGDVLAGFANSPENILKVAPAFAGGIWDQDGNAAQVSRLYDTAFNRLPDLNGFLGNKAALDAGLPLEQLARNFSAGGEFAALYGGPNVAPEALVNALYVNTLNRQPDADGLAFWTGRIASGTTSREQAIVSFSESLEHQLLMLPSIEGGVVFA